MRYNFSGILAILTDMKDAHLKCDQCGAVYSIEDPVCVNGIPQLGSTVSTEIGCPDCLCPNAVLIAAEPTARTTPLELLRIH